MSGERDLAVLLSSMSPSLDPRHYVFCCVDNAEQVAVLVKQQRLKGLYYENEGTTLILEQAIADEYELQYSGTFSCITLNVHSSLDAVGLTAAVSSALALEDISANVVAAFFHDHIFINVEDAQKALTTLRNLSQQ